MLVTIIKKKSWDREYIKMHFFKILFKCVNNNGQSYYHYYYYYCLLITVLSNVEFLEKDLCFVIIADYFPTFTLKNKIENNSTWDGAFYESEWVEINSNWVILFFKCNTIYQIQYNIKFYMHV